MRAMHSRSACVPGLLAGWLAWLSSSKYDGLEEDKAQAVSTILTHVHTQVDNVKTILASCQAHLVDSQVSGGWVVG